MKKLIITLCLGVLMITSLTAKSKDKKNVYIFSGGSAAGVAYGGALKAYELLGEKYAPENTKAVAGSSAGSLAAVGVALGYSPDEMITLLTKIDFGSFMDSKGKLSSIYNFSHIYGWYRGEVLHKFLQKLVEDKTGNKDSTLAEVQALNKSHAEINIIVTDIANMQNVSFNSIDKDTKDIPLALAARTSTSVPLLFDAIFYEKDASGKWSLAKDDSKTATALIDGGILNNYPIIDMQRIYPKDNIEGLFLLQKDEIDWLKTGDRKTDNILNRNSPLKYLSGVYNLLSISRYNQYVQNKSVLDDTVMIDRLGVMTFNLSLTDEQKLALLKSGCESVLKAKDRTDLIPKCKFGDTLLSSNNDSNFGEFISKALNDSIKETQDKLELQAENITQSNKQQQAVQSAFMMPN